MKILGRKKHFKTYIKWCTNNFITIVVFFIVFLIFTGRLSVFTSIFLTEDSPLIINQGQGGLYWVLFAVALINCCVDFILTASDYLGFEN